MALIIKKICREQRMFIKKLIKFRILKKAIHIFVALSFFLSTLPQVYANPPSNTPSQAIPETRDMGKIQVDTGSAGQNQPKLDQAPNGVPIVQIVQPNSNGISHNKFQDFNVGPAGLILNNSQVYGRSNLGGMILGNPNLQQGASARLIINEVTSSNPSELWGFTEIFGHPAEYILANPNGIYANGAGFINIPRVTLSTGIPQFDPRTGGIKALMVDQGKVIVGPRGLSLQGLDFFDVVARATEINGLISAPGNNTTDVRIHTGPQHFNYKDRKTEAKEEGKGEKPVWGIDAAALGGLHAGRITLVATEQGVGVRTPKNMVARAEDMIVTADGQIILNDMEAKGKVHVHSKNNDVIIAENKTVHSDTEVNLEAKKKILVEENATLQSQKKTLVQAQHLENRGEIHGTSEAEIKVQDHLFNTQGAKINSDHNLKITANTLDNAGKIKGQGPTDIQATTLIKNAKEGKIISGKGLTITGGSLQNDGAIRSGENTTITLTQNLQNIAGVIWSARDLKVTSSAFDNAGTIGGKGTVSMEVNGLIKNARGGKIISEEMLTFNGDSLENEGSISSEKDLTIALNQNLKNNRGLIYSNQDMHLHVDGPIENSHGDILIGGDLFVKGNKNPKTTFLENVSGFIETMAGNITIFAKKMTNHRRVDFGTSAPINTGNKTKGSKTTKDIVIHEEPMGYILSAGNITIDADETENIYSTIAAGQDIIINGKDLKNTSKVLQEKIGSWQTVYPKTEKQEKKKKKSWKSKVKKIKKIFINENKKKGGSGGGVVQYDEPSYTKISEVPAIIQAGGKIRGDFTHLISQKNGIEEGKDYLGQHSSKTKPTHTEAAAQFENSILQFETQARRSPLYNYNPQPEHSYLIETRPGYVDPKLFFGSDYFLTRLDMVKGNGSYQKRLGDAFIETRFVRQQIIDKTGLRFLKGYTTDRDMVKALYDNALEEAKALELSPGIKLTKEHVAQLQKDIIWLEPEIIDGQSVLVPHVYLSKITQENLDPESSKIIATHVDLHANTMMNAGLIRGTKSTNINIEGDLIQKGGHIDGGRTIVTVGGTLANLSSIIEGDETSIKAPRIISERLVRRDYYASGYHDSLQGEAIMRAREGNLSVEADEFLQSRGAKFAAKQNVMLDSKGDLDLLAQEMNSELSAQGKRFKYHRHDHRDYKTQIEAGGIIDIHSGQNMIIKGVDNTAEKGIYVKSEGTLDVITIHETSQEDFQTKSKGGFFGGKSKKTQQNASSVIVRNTFNSGGEILLESEGDNHVQTPDMKSKGSTTIQSHQGKVYLETDKSVHSSYTQASGKSSFWQWNQNKERMDEQVEMPHIQAEGGFFALGAKGIDVDIKSQGSVSRSLGRLEKNPKTAWVKDIRNKSNVRWHPVIEKHHKRNKKVQGLTPAASAVIAVAVAIATYGAGGAALGALTTLASESTVGLMASAALTSLATNTTLNLINNQGDPSKALAALVQKEQLRSLVISIAAAGVLKGVGLSGQPTEFSGHLAKAATNTATSTVFSLPFQKPDLKEGLISTAVDAIGGYAANKIKSFRANIGYAGHKLAHGVLGGMMGAILSKDRKSGAISGAMGGMGAEIIGEAITPPDLQQRMLEEARLQGRSSEEAIKAYQQEVRFSADMARLASGSIALFAKQDASIAIHTATNAVENNLVLLFVEETVSLVRTDIPRKGEPEITVLVNFREALINHIEGQYKQTENSVNRWNLHPTVKQLILWPHRMQADQALIMTSLIPTTGSGVVFTIAPTGRFVSLPVKYTVAQLSRARAFFNSFRRTSPPTRNPLPQTTQNLGQGVVSRAGSTFLPESQNLIEALNLEVATTVEKQQKFYMTYFKQHPEGGEPYWGRLKGHGDFGNQRDIDRALKIRDRNHHMNENGFGRAKLDKVSENPNAIRGQEQLRIDGSGGAQSKGGTSSNKINSISDQNSKREQYMDAAKKVFGEN